MRSMIGNKFLTFSTIVILIWGVNFTLNRSLMFPILAINYVVMAFIVFYPLIKEKCSINIRNYWPFLLYWCWLVYSVIRGMHDVHSNVTLKFVLDYLFAALLSLFVFFPDNLINYRNWLRLFWKIGWLGAIILIPFGVSHSFYFHYLLLIIPLWKYLTVKKKIFIICAILFSLRYLDPRAHIPKYLVEMFIFMLPFCFLKDRIIKILHPILLFLPIVLLITGIMGIFNPFNMESYVNSNVKIVQGGETFDATIDTRSVIYEDVILSAVNNEYIWDGRNLANGNDSRFLSYEQRNTNEASILNHFTKMGLVGVILLFFLFVYSSYLAIYKSNNHWVKLIGLYVAFRWISIWIEDMESFSTLYLSIWLTIGICVSYNFRKMTDMEITNYLKTILK